MHEVVSMLEHIQNARNMNWVLHGSHVDDHPYYMRYNSRGGGISVMLLNTTMFAATVTTTLESPYLYAWVQNLAFMSGLLSWMHTQIIKFFLKVILTTSEIFVSFWAAPGTLRKTRDSKGKVSGFLAAKEKAQDIGSILRRKILEQLFTS